MQLPLSVTLRSSRALATLLILIHAVACLVVAGLELGVWITWALLLLIALTAWSCRKHWRDAKRIVLLTLRDKGVLGYVRMNGESGDAKVQRQSTVTPWLTIILLNNGSGGESLVLLPDTLKPEDYRRLRVWLRWQSATG